MAGDVLRANFTQDLPAESTARAPSARHPGLHRARGDWKYCLGAVSVAAALFLALLNPYWVPSGDGDLYVSIARELVRGEGFKFNGQYVNISPPGWPLVLAGLMRVSPAFLTFKLVLIGSMLASLALWYYVLRRLGTSQGRSAGIVILTSLLVHVYSLTFWTHSEALFCVASTGSLLLSLQIAQAEPGRRGLAWRLPLLLGLCAACVLIRWAGVLQFVLVCGALMHGTRWWNAESLARWGKAVSVVVVTVGTFFTVRHTLALSPQQEIAQREAGAVFDEVVAAAPRPSRTADAQKLDLVNLPPSNGGGLAAELLRRTAESGTWLSWLFWQPFRFAASVPALAWLGIVMGWVAIAALGATVAAGVKTRQWLWLALAAYCAMLFINWPNANARYLVPVAPLLLLGAVRGAKLLMVGAPWLAVPRERLGAASVGLLAVLAGVGEVLMFGRPMVALALGTLAGVWFLRLWARTGGKRTADRPSSVARLAVWAFVGSVALVNGALYAVELKVFRSGDFYRNYEAGFNDDLIRACYELNQRGIGDAELAVAERYVNLGRARKSKYAVRAAVLLSGRSVQTVPDRWAGEPRAPLLRWAQRRKVTYYIDQRPSVPWRVWHFVLPRWLNEALVREPLGPDSGGWVLYQLRMTSVPSRPLADRARTPILAQVYQSWADLDGAWRRLEASTRPSTGLTTAPSEAEPAGLHGGYEFRRSASLVDLPEVMGWPQRVPGL